MLLPLRFLALATLNVVYWNMQHLVRHHLPVITVSEVWWFMNKTKTDDNFRCICPVSCLLLRVGSVFLLNPKWFPAGEVKIQYYYSTVYKNATFDQKGCPVSRPITTLGLDPVSKRPSPKYCNFPRSCKLGCCLPDSDILSDPSPSIIDP